LWLREAGKCVAITGPHRARDAGETGARRRTAIIPLLMVRAPGLARVRRGARSVCGRGPRDRRCTSDVPLEQLPKGAVVGSSSIRRKMQLLSRRPDLQIKNIRGNVPTRINKWKEGLYDAIVLARAGMDRLGLSENGFILDPEIFIPAPGQGAIAVVCREDSEHIHRLRELDDITTRQEVGAERYVLKALGAGCSLPVGVWARMEGEALMIMGVTFYSQKEVRAERRIAMSELKSGLDALAAELGAGGAGP